MPPAPAYSAPAGAVSCPHRRRLHPKSTSSNTLVIHERSLQRQHSPRLQRQYHVRTAGGCAEQTFKGPETRSQVSDTTTGVRSAPRAAVLSTRRWFTKRPAIVACRNTLRNKNWHWKWNATLRPLPTWQRCQQQVTTLPVSHQSPAAAVRSAPLGWFPARRCCRFPGLRPRGSPAHTTRINFLLLFISLILFISFIWRQQCRRTAAYAAGVT